MLVGIGGGVPRKTENEMIRLGDVVVSKPTGEHLGALQYDHGKAEAVVKLLLQKGAEVESKNENGRTPLSLAAFGWREMVVKLLLEKGTELESKDKDGDTPLSLAAAISGYEAVVKLLLEKGAKLESKKCNIIITSCS
jgi:ankyrin repeat protein